MCVLSDISESNITQVLFVTNITSANVISYNSSVNKLILGYILNTMVSVFEGIVHFNQKKIIMLSFTQT